MAKVSPFSPFRLEDFASQQSWIGTLFLPLNSVLTQVTQALNGQVTFGENVPAYTKVITGSNVMLPQTFQAPQGFQASQMAVAQAIKAGVPIVMVGAWAQSGDTITVSKLFELTETGPLPIVSGTKYSIALKFT